jgi:hypothetical protein
MNKNQKSEAPIQYYSVWTLRKAAENWQSIAINVLWAGIVPFGFFMFIATRSKGLQMQNLI